MTTFINRHSYKKSGNHDENNANTVDPSRIRIRNYVLCDFNKPKTDSVSTISTYGCPRIYDRICFFIQQYIIHREQIQKKRHDHFKTIKTCVFEPLIKESAILSKTRDRCNNSFIDLYVNIFDKLKSNLRFQRVKSHLENDEYKEAKSLLGDIEKRSTDHNKKISHFMGSVKGMIFFMLPYSQKTFFPWCPLQNTKIQTKNTVMLCPLSKIIIIMKPWETMQTC
ncbi:MAG: hypothetical protein WAM14_26280 [Candidatus Nitrosopolaris sp.]